jgi:hypothetical protein
MVVTSGLLLLVSVADKSIRGSGAPEPDPLRVT